MFFWFRRVHNSRIQASKGARTPLLTCLSSSNHQINLEGDFSSNFTKTLSNDLSHELQLSIVSHIDPMSRNPIRSVISHFRDLLSPLTNHQFHAAENSIYASNHNLLACRVCLRLRFNDRFDNDQLTKFDSLLWSARFCIDRGSRPLTMDPEEDYDRFSISAGLKVDAKRYGRCARCRGCTPGN